MSKIVLLNGSPRKNGNTAKLSDAFTKGAEAAGHEVTKFSVVDTKVNGCIACEHCIRNEGRCVQKDGMQDIYTALHQSDTVVFVTPVYFFGMSAQIKAIIDRLYAGIAKPFPITSAVLLAAYGRSDETDLGVTVDNYKTIINYIQWEDKGILAVSGVIDRDDIVGNPALLQAEELGRSM